jgi:hypothetical protein
VVSLISPSTGTGTFLFDDITGISAYAIANPATQANSITVFAFGTNGSTIGSTTMTIEPRSRVAGFLRDLSGLASIPITYR